MTTTLDLPRTNVVELTGNRSVNIDPRWHNKSTNGDLPVGWRTNPDVIDAYNALAQLQVKRDQPLTKVCLDVPLELVYDSLPTKIMNYSGIMPADESILTASTGAFNGIVNNWIDPTDVNRSRSPWYILLKSLREKNFTAWPIKATGTNDEPHWIVVLIHTGWTYRRMNKRDVESSSEDTDMELEGRQREQCVECIAVIDPERGVDARRREKKIYKRVVRLVTESCSVPMSRGFMRRAVWVHPMNPADYPWTENFSSGLRVYAIIREWIDRIVLMHCRSPMKVNDDDLWDGMTGFFHSDRVRAEMVGYAAMAVLRSLECRARISIEPVGTNSLRYKNLVVPVTRLLPSNVNQDTFAAGPGPQSEPVLIEAIDEDSDSSSDPASVSGSAPGSPPGSGSGSDSDSNSDSNSDFGDGDRGHSGDSDEGPGSGSSSGDDQPPPKRRKTTGGTGGTGASRPAVKRYGPAVKGFLLRGAQKGTASKS